MKFINYLIFVVFTIQQVQASWSEEDRRIEAEQVALWEKKLEETRHKTKSEKISELWLGLKNMGQRKKNVERSDEVDRIYNKLQQELISISGHAQYFADEIETFRTRVQHLPRGNQTAYDTFRLRKIAEILPHLPSPETITVLGNYLYDERDAPHDRTFRPENAHLAAYALSQIGLRDCPFEGILAPIRLTYVPDWKQLPIFRSWWEEVKSGKRTFSFVGQKVEYRFKPDGTWDTALLNPPNDGAKRGEQNKQAKATNAVDSTAKPERATGYRWGWLTVSLMLALLGVAWLNKKKAA